MKMAYWQKGDEAWQRGEIREARRWYEKSFNEENFPPRVLLFFVLLSLIVGEKKRAFEVLSYVRKWNLFDLTAREIEQRAEDILEGRLDIIRLDHVIGWFSKEETVSKEEYHSMFSFIENVWRNVEEVVKRRPLASVVLSEITVGFATFSRGGYILRNLLPKIEIARGFWNKGVVGHELAHVMYPSMNLFLTEGLSLWVQHKIGGKEKGWPFDVAGFGEEGDDNALDEVVGELLVSPRFFTTEALEAGKALPWYALAWKWVSFVVDKEGLEKFLDLYELCRYGDKDVREIFSTLYGTRDFWLREKMQVTKVFDIPGETGDYTPERIQKLQEVALLWEKNHEKDLLRFLCKEGWSMVTYLRGITIGEGETHPDFPLFVTYLHKTEEWLKEALKWWPEDASLHCYLAELYGLHIEILPEEKRMPLALLMQREVKKALEIDPGYEDAKVALGRILIFTPPLFGGGLEKGRRYLREVLERNPTHVEALAWDGYVDYREGKKEKAEEKWKYVLSLQPSHFFALRMLERLEKEITEENS